MKKSTLLSFVTFAIAIMLTSCSILPTSRVASDSQMQTEIVQILTAMVTETATPIMESTIPVEVQEPTEQSTESNVQAGTPTVEIGQLITSTASDQSFEFYSRSITR